MDWEGAGFVSPNLEILVQPQPKFRFRYKSEMTGKHGSLLGIQQIQNQNQGVQALASTTALWSSQSPSPSQSGGGLGLGHGQDFESGPSTSASTSTSCGNQSSAIQTKLFPTVKLHNFHGEAVIRASIVCDTQPHFPHPHLLQVTPTGEGKGPTEEGSGSGTSSEESYSCYIEVPVSEENDHTAVFQGLNIIFVSKKESKKVLLQKMKQVQDHRKLSPEALDELIMNVDMNTVALYFEAFPKGLEQKPLCGPVVSTPIQHNKSTQTGELRIVRIDKVSSCCTGNEEVFILVEKVDKHNIQVKFYEETLKGVEIWKAYGKFSKLDVHHQYAIVFRTPAYKSIDIDVEVDVWLQLERPSDGAISQPIPFRYRPLAQIRKLPKRQPRSNQEEESGRDFETREGGQGSSQSQSQSQSGSSSGNGNGNALSGNANIRQGSNQTQAPFSFLNINQLSSPSSESSTNAIMSDDAKKSKALAMSVALSICEGLHGWAESSDFNLVLQKVRHLLCLVNGNGDNALHSAIINQQKEPFLQILETLSSFPDTCAVINEPNTSLLTPIHLAVLVNRMDFVTELLRHNVDISMQNGEGDTPLHLAVKGNDVPLVKLLLQAPSAAAAINKFNYASMSPLLLAISGGNTELVELLCCNKASLTAQEGTLGKTPLHLAVEKETKESIISTMILLRSSEKEQDLANIQNYRGDTPLHVAANAGYTTLSALLMHYGADPTIQNHMRKETEDEEEESEEEKIEEGQTVFDLVTSEKVLRVLKGTVDDWEIILRACSPLLLSSGEKDKEFDRPVDTDSGLDVNTFSSHFSSNQL